MQRLSLPRRGLLGGLALGPALLARTGAAQVLDRPGQSPLTDRNNLLTAARLVSTALSTELDRQWDRLKAAASNLERGPASRPAAELRGLMDGLRRDAPHTVWIGIANARDGRVTSGSGGVLEGADVSERPWFQAARTRDFAGDVHAAVLLERALNRGPGAEPLRLIDFATPLRRGGQVTAVLGSHVDWQWILTIIRNAPVPPGATVAILSQDNQLLFGPGGNWMADLTRYSVAPVLQKAEAPSLGWRAVGLPASLLRG